MLHGAFLFVFLIGSIYAQSVPGFNSLFPSPGDTDVPNFPTQIGSQVSQPAIGNTGSASNFQLGVSNTPSFWPVNNNIGSSSQSTAAASSNTAVGSSSSTVLLPIVASVLNFVSQVVLAIPSLLNFLLSLIFGGLGNISTRDPGEVLQQILANIAQSLLSVIDNALGSTNVNKIESQFTSLVDGLVNILNPLGMNFLENSTELSRLFLNTLQSGFQNR